jgi:class 3 adenylate cyclase
MISLWVEYYNFLCIDIVGSSIEIDSQLNNIEDLLKRIKDFLSTAAIEEELQTSFTGDGAIIWFKKDSLLPLQLALKIHESFPPSTNELYFGIKIGISRDKAAEIESAKSILGIPVWGKGPTFARRLCDLCDEGHILMDDNAYKFFTDNYKNMTHKHFGFNIVEDRFFQDLGEFFVKHRKSIHVYNYCNTKKDKDLFGFGNINIPRDKRGLIDRIDINSKLVVPFDLFLESEALSLKKKIDMDSEIVLLDESIANLYYALFEDANQYYSTNLLVPSKFQEYQLKTSYLNYQANMIRRSKDKNFVSVRIMILDKSLILKDWQNSKTRNLCADFFSWHKEWGVTLLQLEPNNALEIVRMLEDRLPTFYLKSNQIALWKEKYAVQSENFGTNENNNSGYRNRIWISDSNSTYYKNSEIFIQELLSSEEIWEIQFEEKAGIDFVKWDHKYWKPKL